MVVAVDDEILVEIVTIGVMIGIIGITAIEILNVIFLPGIIMIEDRRLTDRLMTLVNLAYIFAISFFNL